jgi:hypothetical protein
MKSLNICFVLSILIVSCQVNKKPEDPRDLCRSFCNCVSDLLFEAEDSSVNISECNPVFYSSRFMTIHLDQDKENYSQETLDSANTFFLNVGDLIDSICLSKINSRKLKKIPHAKM